MADLVSLGDGMKRMQHGMQHCRVPLRQSAHIPEEEGGTSA